MKLIVKRAKVFNLPANRAGGDGRELTLTVDSSPIAQELPDWIAQTNTYRDGIADLSIAEVD